MENSKKTFLFGSMQAEAIYILYIIFKPNIKKTRNLAIIFVNAHIMLLANVYL